MESQRKAPGRRRIQTCLRHRKTCPRPAKEPITRLLSSSDRSPTRGRSPIRRRSTRGCHCLQTWKFQKISFPVKLFLQPWRVLYPGKYHKMIMAAETWHFYPGKYSRSGGNCPRSLFKFSDKIYSHSKLFLKFALIRVLMIKILDKLLNTFYTGARSSEKETNTNTKRTKFHKSCVSLWIDSTNLVSVTNDCQSQDCG